MAEQKGLFKKLEARRNDIVCDSQKATGSVDLVLLTVFISECATCPFTTKLKP